MITNWLFTYITASFSIPLGYVIARKTKSEWEGTAVLKHAAETLVLVAAALVLYVSLGSEPLAMYSIVFGIAVGYFTNIGYEFLPAASLVYFLDPAVGAYIAVVLSALWITKGTELTMKDMFVQWALFIAVSMVFGTSGLFVFASMIPFLTSFFVSMSVGQLVKIVDN